MAFLISPSPCPGREAQQQQPAAAAAFSSECSADAQPHSPDGEGNFYRRHPLPALIRVHRVGTIVSPSLSRLACALPFARPLGLLLLLLLQWTSPYVPVPRFNGAPLTLTTRRCTAVRPTACRPNLGHSLRPGRQFTTVFGLDGKSQSACSSQFGQTTLEHPGADPTIASPASQRSGRVLPLTVAWRHRHQRCSATPLEFNLPALGQASHPHGLVIPRVIF